MMAVPFQWKHLRLAQQQQSPRLRPRASQRQKEKLMPRERPRRRPMWLQTYDNKRNQDVRKGGLSLREVASLHDGFVGGFDGFGSSAKHHLALSLVLQNAGQRGNRDGFDSFGGFGGCGGFGRDGYPPLKLNPPSFDILRELLPVPCVPNVLPTVKNQEKGVVAKGVSEESSVTPKNKNTLKHWTQQDIWHSERHSQGKRTFLQKPPSKNPLSWQVRQTLFILEFIWVTQKSLRNPCP